MNADRHFLQVWYSSLWEEQYLAAEYGNVVIRKALHQWLHALTLDDRVQGGACSCGDQQQVDCEE
jgi:hypothetical protein